MAPHHIRVVKRVGWPRDERTGPAKFGEELLLQRDTSGMATPFLVGNLPKLETGGCAGDVWVRNSESVASRLDCSADSQPAWVGSARATPREGGTQLKGSLKACEMRAISPELSVSLKDSNPLPSRPALNSTQRANYLPNHSAVLDREFGPLVES